MVMSTEFGGEIMATRDELHKFIDSLPDGLVGEVLDFAQFVAKKAQSEQIARVMAAGQVPDSGVNRRLSLLDVG